MRTFHLQRSRDETGVSGTGRVAEGVEFSNGRVALSWLTTFTSIAIYDDIEHIDRIHGHKGATQIIFD